MRCSKCGAESPDDQRVCPVCGHKLQSGRHGVEDGKTADSGDHGGPLGGLLRFQGWVRPGRGSGPYVEACLYAVILLAGVVWYLLSGLSWPLYALFGVVALVAGLRRL